MAEQGEPVNVSKSMGKSDLPQLSALKNNIYIIWRDNSTGNDDIYFTKSSDSGLSFDDSVNLSNNSGTSAFPRVAIVGNNVYATWYDYTPGQSDIFFAKSSDNGDSFKTINLSDNGGVSYNPWVAAYENNVYVVWNDETPKLTNIKVTSPEGFDVALGTLDILLAKSHDGGSTFEVSNLSDSVGNSGTPRIAVYENNVYVVWTESIDTNDEIFFTVSNDDGKSFSRPINVSRTSTSSLDAAIEVSENHVYIIWHESEPGMRDIFFSKSDDNGLSFTDPVRISNGGAAQLSRDTQMAVSEDNVYVVWFDRSAKGGVYFVKSNDHENSFSMPIDISGQVPGMAMAQIAVYQDSLYVIWQDGRLGNSEVFLRSSIDQGQTFGNIINLSKDNSESNLFILGPQIATNDQNVYTVFEKINERGSDLFLVKLIDDQQLHNGTLVLQTMDGKINVQTSFDKKTIDATQPVIIKLKFFNASTSQPLTQVNYSLKIDNFQGNNILTKSNLFTENGTDNHELSFPETGPFIITVFIDKIGDYYVQEGNFSSTSDMIITVVPEFPSALIIIGIIMSFVILKQKFSSSSIYNQNKTNSF